MLFSSFNTPASNQKYINKILANKPHIFIIIYLNYMLFYTNKADNVDAVW